MKSSTLETIDPSQLRMAPFDQLGGTYITWRRFSGCGILFQLPNILSKFHSRKSFMIGPKCMLRENTWLLWEYLIQKKRCPIRVYFSHQTYKKTYKKWPCQSFLKSPVSINNLQSSKICLQVNLLALLSLWYTSQKTNSRILLFAMRHHFFHRQCEKKTFIELLVKLA